MLCPLILAILGNVETEKAKGIISCTQGDKVTGGWEE